MAWPSFFLWFDGPIQTELRLEDIAAALHESQGTPTGIICIARGLTRINLEKCQTVKDAIAAAKSVEKVLGLQLVVMTKGDGAVVIHYGDALLYFYQEVCLGV